MNVEPLEKYLKGDNIEIYNKIISLFPKDGWLIAGGAARQIFLNERLGSTDIDFYFSSIDSYDAQYHRLYRQIGVPHRSGNAATFYLDNTQVQLVAKIYSDTPKEIFDTYDMTCCMFAITNNLIYFTDEAREHALGKWIVLSTPIKENYIRRIGKYLRKGYCPLCMVSQGVLLDFLAYANSYESWNNTEPDAAEILDGYFGTDIRY